MKTAHHGRGRVARRIRTILLPVFVGSMLLQLAGCSSITSRFSARGGVGTYPVVDTGQSACYDSAGRRISPPKQGAALFGQDAQHSGNQPSYTDNGDGTVTDNITGMMWQKSPDTNDDGRIDCADKMTYADAIKYAKKLSLAEHKDWRLPTIKQLYSLIDFDGIDPTNYDGSTSGLVPFIDRTYFDFGYGDITAGERVIDAQFASSTKYVATTMGGAKTMFGVNFADGRIKGYPIDRTPKGDAKKYYVLCVRDNSSYGRNLFTNNGNGTITDVSTSLMWAKGDSRRGLNWQEALAYVQQMNTKHYLGHNDWRLPNAKELQSIVDYSRSPATSKSAAIDPIFNASRITNEADQRDWPCYWTSTTHVSTRQLPGSAAAYVAFGRAMGFMRGEWMDVHGAGAQRSDPKTGDPSAFPRGRGPQGDAIRIYNYVRLVRDADTDK